MAAHCQEQASPHGGASLAVSEREKERRMKISHTLQPLFFMHRRYFETFDAISDVGIADRLHMLKMVAKCSSNEELGEGKVAPMRGFDLTGLLTLFA